jgi:hypothetical protein
VCCARGPVVPADSRPGDIAEQIEQVNEATRRLLAGLDGLAGADAARPSLLPLNDTPMMRLSEVEIHHVDLGDRFRPDGWPDSFVARILAGADRLSERLPDGLALRVHATDSDEHWTADAGGGAGAEGSSAAEGGSGVPGGSGAQGGAGPLRVIVAGPSWAIAAWLVGRPGPVADALSVTGGELPPLKPWP